jgi:hypothetical protein
MPDAPRTASAISIATSVDIAGVQKLPKASRPGTTATASHQEPPATLPSSSD